MLACLRCRSGFQPVRRKEVFFPEHEWQGLGFSAGMVPPEIVFIREIDLVQSGAPPPNSLTRDLEVPTCMSFLQKNREFP